MPKQKSKAVRKKVASKKKVSVKPIPSGFGSVTSYLVVNDGNAAIEFYKKAFAAKELVRNPAPNGKVMNAQIKIGDSIVMISDEFPGANARSPSSVGTTTVTMHIYSKNVDKLWQQVTEAGGRVIMPLDNQFWGDRYGQILDPFGHLWSLAQHVKMSAKEMEEKQKAAMEMFAAEHSSSPPEQPVGGVG